jgi:hypothetical protein
MYYRGEQSNFAKEIRAFSEMAQDIEATLFEIAKFRLLPYATGHQLDVLGVLIGGGNAPRLGRSDTDYRQLLIAQTFINQSRGEPERLTAALKALTGATWTAYYEYQPASIYQQFAGTTAPAQLLSQMRRIKAAGARYALAMVDPDSPFTFDVGPGFDSGKLATQLT